MKIVDVVIENLNLTKELLMAKNIEHPSIIAKNPEVMLELLQRLSKEELISEVEFLKSQREQLLKTLQEKDGRIRSLETEIDEYKLDEESK